VACVAGFRLTVRPTVFHPRYFLTSEFFANFLSDIDLAGKRVADVGTGSGILALAAARAGAASVVALDINPNAAKVAAENAHANGLGKPTKRRAAIEPVIGHLKEHHRMGRNYLAHASGDAINAVLVAAGYNFRRLLAWLSLLLLRILIALGLAAQLKLA
jgi:SAM-dependent methyltransferase